MKRGQRLSDETRVAASRLTDERVAAKHERERRRFPAAFPVEESESEKMKKRFRAAVELAVRGAVPRSTRDYLDGVEEGARLASEALFDAIDAMFSGRAEKKVVA